MRLVSFYVMVVVTHCCFGCRVWRLLLAWNPSQACDEIFKSHLTLFFNLVIKDASNETC